MMLDLHEKYKLKIVTLSPLHIGSGSQLRENLDYLIDGRDVLVMDQGGFYNLVLDHLISRFGETTAVQKMRDIAGKPISNVVRETNLNANLITDTGSPAVSYRFALREMSPDNFRQQPLNLFIKNPRYRPYIPGSSLKGSFRSSVLRYLTRDDESIQINYGRGRGRPDGRDADDILEREKFSTDTLGGWHDFPNDDIWRGVHITDTNSVPPDRMVLAKGEVYPLDGHRAFDLFFEVIPPNKVFRATLTLDRWLFLESANRARGTSRDPISPFSEDSLDLFRDLPYIIDQDSRHLFNQEMKFLINLENENRYDIASIQHTKTYFRQIAKVIRELKENEFVTTVGFGTGWLAKTLGDQLQGALDDDAFRKMVNAFGLGKKKWHRNQVIPYTRLVVDADRYTRAPLGWIKVTMEKLDDE